MAKKLRVFTHPNIYKARILKKLKIFKNPDLFQKLEETYIFKII